MVDTIFQIIGYFAIIFVGFGTMFFGVLKSSTPVYMFGMIIIYLTASYASFEILTMTGLFATIPIVLVGVSLLIGGIILYFMFQLLIGHS